MAPKTKWIRLTSEQQAEQQAKLSRIVPTPGWCIIPQQELPGVFVESFRARIDSALLIAVPTSTGGTYLVTDALRIDRKDQSVDHEPFGLIVHSTGPSASGVFLHHGNWEGRTESPPPGFWDHVKVSGIGDYFCTNPPGGLPKGNLEQLPKSHRNAFDAIVRQIRARLDNREGGSGLTSE